MKLKTKAGLKIGSGKQISHRISVDENTVACAVVAATAVILGKTVDGLTRVAINLSDGLNNRLEIKLEHKLNEQKPKKK